MISPKKDSDKESTIFQGLFDNSPLCIALLNKDRKIVEINKSAEKLFGLKRDECIGTDYLTLSKIPKKDVPILASRFETLLDGKMLDPIDIQMYDRKDKPLWVSVFSSRLKIGSDDLIQVIIQNINDRRLMEQELRQKEELYRTLINNIEDIVIELNAVDGIISYISPQVKQVLGYEQKELINTCAFDVIHPDDFERVKNILLHSIKTGNTVSYDHLVKKKKGGYASIYVVGGIRKINHKLKIIAVLRDFSDVKNINAKYKHLYNEFPYGVILLRSDGIIIDVNSAIESEFGYQKHDFIGRNFFNIPGLPPEIISLLKVRFVEEHKKGNRLDPITIQIRKEDGSTAWINPYISLVKIGNDKYVQIITKDVSERIRAMNELKESEEIFRNIAEQSFMGIAIIQDYLPKYLNKQAEKIIDYSFDDILLEKPNSFLEIVHPEDREMVNERAHQRQEGVLKTLTNYQCRIKRKSGEYIWIEVFSKLISFKGKQASLITFMDISKDKEVQDLLLNEIKKLRETEDIRKNFINRISHELKSPLTTITGATELLNDILKDKLSEDELEILKIIIRGSERLKKLIAEILDISKLEEQESQIIKKQENLSDIVKESINNLVHMLKERELSLAVEIAPEINANVDKIRIEQVFNNLISNAIKYTPKGGKIKVELMRNNHSAVFSVQDNGVGIKKSDFDKLFKEFSRIQHPRKEIINEGTGLGLYLSKQIVKLHGGEILAESEGKDNGSTFKVKLPLK